MLGARPAPAIVLTRAFAPAPFVRTGFPPCPCDDRAPGYGGRMTYQPPNTTTDSGIPVPSDEHALTVGQAGPVLLQDYYLNEKLAHFVRERIPDRVYHVKGGGAFG